VSKLVELVDIVTNFYTYEGTVKALNKVSLTIEHGSSFGLVGESGCGKSVTARSIMRVVQEPGRIESGSVLLYLDEHDERKMIDLMQQSEDYMVDLRGNKISMIFQEPNAALNPIMSVGEQVAESFLFHRKQDLCNEVLNDLNSPDCKAIYPLKKLLHAIYRAADENPDSVGLKLMSKIPVLKWWRRRMKREALKQSVEIIAKLGIPNPAEVVKLYPHNLSGGMKQRIVIAIALACNPVLLIADEATSNLDVTIQAQILELLRELKQKEISSVLLITHDLGVVAETCDRVGVMYAGNLCEVADVKDLFSHPRHPYTRALLDSVPKLSQEGELQSIEGNVPNLVTPPPGCRFHPRCPYRKGVCSVELPELRKVGKNHQAACHVLPE
jgi:peptide/nickel transport system ATP-binding protein